MFGNMNGAVIAGVLAGLAGLGLGIRLGGDIEARKTEKKVEAVRSAATKVINAKLQEILTLQAETAQAKSEVEKVNATTRKQFEELQAMLQSDAVKREEAALKVEKAASQAARDARDASSRAQAAREVIQNAADKCATAGVPDDVIRMLNGIRTPTP